ncbi:MAG: AsmA-like C-terminal region-containing protein [Bacteroidales bacterium]
MKKALKITGLVVIVLLALLLTLPLLFSGKIKQAVKDQAATYIDAKVDFGKISLSLIRNFPNLSLSVYDLTLAGNGKFEGDTLTRVPRLTLVVDLFSAIKGSTYEIKSIKAYDPFIYLKVLPDSAANWDIYKAPATTDTTAPSAFTLKMKSVEINNATVVYDDRLLNTLARVEGINSKLSGDMTEKLTTLLSRSTVGSITVDYGGIRYLSQAQGIADVTMDADFNHMVFTLKDNEIKINDLILGLSGKVKMLDDGYDLDLSFKSKETSFKSLLSLIPALYAQDFDKLTARGSLQFDGNIKGLYTETRMPAYEVKLVARDGYFRYPDLPAAVENVNLLMQVSNPTGDPDQTYLDLSQLHLEMAGNPVDISLKLKTPISNPWISTKIKGKLNLEDIKKIYPLQKDVKGTLAANLFLEGYSSALEKQQYDQFKAEGNLQINNLFLPDSAFSEGIKISSALLNFSPAFAELAHMSGSLGRNSFDVQGKITNYLGYYLKNEPLKGQFTFQSSYLNLNDFMQGQSTSSRPADTVALKPIAIPAQIDFTLKANIATLLYDKLELKNVNGTVLVRNQQLILDGLTFNTLGGTMALKGSYDTRQPDKPSTSLEMNLKEISIAGVASNFVSVKKIAPVMEKLTGTVSASLNLSTLLGPDMMPDLNTLFSSGKIETGALKVSGVNALNKLDEALKINKLSNLNLSPAHVAYLIEGGKLMLKPFELKAGNLTGTLAGEALVGTRELNLDFLFSIPRSEFGGAANNVLNGLVAEAGKKGLNINPGEVINIASKITGTVDNPKVSVSLAQSGGSMVTGLKQQAEQQFNQKKEELEAKARAELEAQKAAAEQKLRQEQEKLKQEAEKKKAELEARAKKEADSLKKKGEQELKKKLKKFF